MHPRKVLSGLALGLSLLCVPALASAADEPDKAAPAKAAAAAKAAVPADVTTEVITIMPPETDIVITLPLMLVERGTVESVDAGAGVFELKRKDGSTAKIQVTDNTMMENVYADIFSREDRKGISDLKKGDRVRARVFAPRTAGGVENALLVDVFHL